jgi:glucosylceramidase
MLTIKYIKFLVGFIICVNITSCTKTTTPKINIDLTNLKSSVFTTAHGTNLKLSPTASLNFKEFKQPLETDISIQVDPSKEFQTLLGIGGALTDASAETYAKLPKASQKKIIEAYFDKNEGIGYSLGRTSIHSCDFGTGSFTYIDEGDTDLTTFSIEHDQKYRLPFIKTAIEKANGELTFYVSPWSPPAFMKTNNNMLLGGKLKPEFYQPWANYYAKFIKAYEKEGIPIWGLTIQNEPMAKQRWESCIYTAEEERDFLKYYLGPTLKKQGLGDKKIVVWDHNRDLLFQRANTIFNDSVASKYAWGSGFHWYEDWKDGRPMYNMVQRVNENYPEKKLLFTEGCNESYDIERLINDDPKLAERYGKSMINDFNNGTVGWTDWNILLDQNGGPNHVGNLCFSPVHANTDTGEVTFTRSFYYIGHFSKFIQPGAKRITSVSSGNSLLSTAFKNNNGSIVIIALNDSENPIKYSIQFGGKTALTSILPHAIQTHVLTK